VPWNNRKLKDIYYTGSGRAGMPEGGAHIVTDVVIVGGGPAGILLAHRFREHGIRHKVLERGKVGQSWRDMRPGMVLLSPGVPGTDWTSLTLERPIWSFPGVRRPFPTREDFLCYVDAFARDQGNSVFLLCLTSGEAGENPQSGDQRGEHLARRRAEELRGAAAVLGIQHEIAGFTNGAFKRKYPNQRLWLPGAALEAWREVRDPEQVVVDVATQLKPHIVLAIEPNWGWTGHPEHRAAAELARSAASRVGAEVAYAVMSAAEFTDQFDTSRWSGKRGMSYWTVKIAAARHHVSQYRLPTDAEKHPEQSPDLSVEHFRRGGTVESDK